MVELIQNILNIFQNSHGFQNIVILHQITEKPYNRRLLFKAKSSNLYDIYDMISYMIWSLISYVDKSIGPFRFIRL